MKAFVTAVAVVAVAVIIAVGFAYYTYRVGFYAKEKKKVVPDPLAHRPLPPEGDPKREEAEFVRGLISELISRPFEPAEIRSTLDGTKLYARFYNVKEGAPIIIECHGYRGHPMIDTSGGNRFARENGYNTLVIDERAHGLSGGNTITFGVKERYDVRDWAYYCAEKYPGTPIVLAGVSMGAATVLMVSEMELPPEVRCICADAPYSSQKKIIEKTIKEMHIPPKIAYPFTVLGAKIFGKFDLNARTPLQAVANAKLPILLIHGEADGFVPCYMSIELNEAIASEHEFYTFPDAGHVMSYIADHERYEKLTKAFLAKHI